MRIVMKLVKRDVHGNGYLKGLDPNVITCVETAYITYMCRRRMTIYSAISILPPLDIRRTISTAYHVELLSLLCVRLTTFMKSHVGGSWGERTPCKTLTLPADDSKNYIAHGQST